MKKRRPCTGNQTRSPVNSPRAAIHSAASDTISSLSKSFQDLKRRRLQRGNATKQPRRQRGDSESLKNSGLKKKDAFGSLESLFDVKRPLNVPEIPRYFTREQADDFSSSSSEILKNPEPLIVDLYNASQRVEQEPDSLVENWESTEFRYESDISKVEEFEIEAENMEQEGKGDEGSPTKIRSNDAMANDPDKNPPKDDRVPVKEDDPVPVKEDDRVPVEEDDRVPVKEDDRVPEMIDDQVPEPSAPPEEETHTEFPVDEIKMENASGDQANKDNTPKPPEYALPPGAGEGVPIKLGGNRDSILSSTPLTDSEVIREMTEADKRCKIVAQEIEDTRQQINELKHKENLSEEDTREIQEKQAALLTKMKEFDEITRKIQRVVGLSDPSSRTFAKMFDMLPYPHNKPGSLEEEEAAAKDKKAKEEKEIFHKSDKDTYEDHFELPQPEYPEDKLPRAIICGFTEDRIPKIVIPDSRPKGTRCLKNLTGKLSESLNMQEKLVQENAKLEGGRYKLEEALLEKDNTLDCLQRKVCGLQAEMRIVVKENTELNRQLASLGNNQRTSGSPVCCFTCPGDNSSRSTNRQQSSYSYASSPRDESCRCRHCMQEQFDLETGPASTICVNPEDLHSYQQSSATSPRLSGGGSREIVCNNSGPSTSRGPTMCCRGPASVNKPPGPSSRAGPCPAEMENQLTNYGNNTKQLAQQLDSMECEVRNMQMELANVHRERQQLEQQRKLLKCTGPCAPCSCCPPGTPHLPSSCPAGSTPIISTIPCPSGGTSVPPDAMINLPLSMKCAKMSKQQEIPACSGVCVIAPMGASTCPQQQLRDLREQYARLQEDYKNKLCEVSCLRTEAEKLKQETAEAKEEREKAEARINELQIRHKSMETDRRFGSKEIMVEQEQALLVAKQRYRDAQDELEELRSLIQDQANQLEDYRNKYLQAQEQVEEQRRQLDLMEMDNARMNENVNLEIGRVKNQFKEKLAELAPLPDILKQTQMKLQEVMQMRLIAERNCEDLSRELLTSKDKVASMMNELGMMRSANSTLSDEKGMGSGRCEELERKNAELKSENERMKITIEKFKDQESQLQQRMDEKIHEVVQLSAMLDQVREDSARQVARTKERCDTVRRTMQGQIAEMEKQLAHCRATARAAQKDRDEIRQKMQGQIINLMEAFDQAQGRIRSLQGHVNYLKTSHSNIFTPGVQGEPPIGYIPSETTGQGQGYDSCDCNY